MTICGCCLATQYKSSLSSFVLNFRILIQIVSEKSLTKISIFITLKCLIEKGNKINKGTDRHYVANPLIHSTALST